MYYHQQRCANKISNPICQISANLRRNLRGIFDEFRREDTQCRPATDGVQKIIKSQNFIAKRPAKNRRLFIFRCYNNIQPPMCLLNIFTKKINIIYKHIFALYVSQKVASGRNYRLCPTVRKRNL